MPSSRIEWKAVASLVLGVISTLAFTIFAGFSAILLGHLSRSDIKSSNGELKGKGMALAGLVLGYLSLAFLFIGAWHLARVATNESSALMSVRRIDQAASRYKLTSGGSYPNELPQLGKGDAGPSLSKGIEDIVAVGEKDGYRFKYSGIDADGDQLIEGYTVEALPLQPKISGNRSFCSDQTGAVRMAPAGEKCTASSLQM